MGRAAAILVLASVALGGVVARAQPDDAPPATKLYETDDKRFSMSVPFAWRLSREQADKSVMSWSAATTEGAAPLELTLYSVPGILHARQQAWVERGVHPKRYDVAGPGHVETEPVPHVWIDVPESGVTVRYAWFYRVIRRNGLTLHVACDADRWDALRPEFVRIAQSVDTKLPEWPPAPEGYRRVARDGYVEYLHPSVKESAADEVHRTLRAEEAEFSKRWGPLWKPPECPLVVVLHARAADAATVDQPASQSPHGNFTSGVKHVLYAVPPAKGDAEAAADLVEAAWKAFFLQSYGGAVPYWIYLGEPAAEWSQTSTGRPLPAVSEATLASLPRQVRPLAELDAIESASAADAAEMFAYAAFFRCGPKAYRDAFAAFLKDAVATGDCATAQAKHLLSLDGAKLRTAAQSFVTRELKAAKPK